MNHSSIGTRFISGSERLTRPPSGHGLWPQGFRTLGFGFGRNVLKRLTSANRWLCLMFFIPVLATNVAAQNADEASSPPPAASQNPDGASTPKPADPGVAVDRFDFSYGLTLPNQPPLDELKSLTIKSTRDGNVFRAPAESGAEDLTLSSLPEGSRFDGGTLLSITQEVVRWCAAHGLNGVWVAFTDIEPSVSGVIDNRSADNHVAQLLIWVTQNPPAETNVPPPVAAQNADEAIAPESASASKPDVTVAPPVATPEVPETNSPAGVAAVTTEDANAPQPVVAPAALETTVSAQDEAAQVQAAAPASENAAATPAEATVPAKDAVVLAKDGVPPTSEVPAPVQDAQAPATAEAAPVSETAVPAIVEAAPANTASASATEEATVPAQNPTAPAKVEPVPAAETITSPMAEVAPAPDVVAPAPEPVLATPEAVTPTQDNIASTPPDAPTPAQVDIVPTSETNPSPVADAAPATDTLVPVPAPAVASPEPVTPAPESVAVTLPDTGATTPAPLPESVQPPAPVESPAPAPAAVPAPVDAGVVVNHFEFSYGLSHPDLPPLEQLNQLTVKATRDGDVFRAPAASGVENLTLSGVPAGSRFDGGALRGIAQEVVRWYNTHGLYGVWVAYTDLENSAAGVVDNRSADNQAAHMVIWASQVAEVRTLARGNRIKPQFSINNRKHRRIISRSPLHPGATPDEPGSLFNQDLLNDYLYGLSLHPGRRVEASIASAGQPGKVVLDFLVNESKPWQIFSQVNNYGTEQTGQYRARLGFQHNQLTNHDDILNVDLISTPDFKTYGSFISYRIPLWRPAKILYRIYGSYGDFVASDATSVVELRYVGRNWLGGMELTNRLTLWRNWQLLSALGFNFNHYGIQQVINENPLVTGSSNFLVPFIGTTLSRNFPWGSVSGGLRFDHTVGSFANLDTTTGIPALGRRGAEPDWTSARWNLNGTVYLEPLFSRTDKALTLAHEFSVRVKGRVLLRGKRLIPHEQEPLGGALSIRGYPESILSADEFVAATVEYAYHIPRGLKPAEEGTLFHRPFKWRPKLVGQNPDWDLVLRAFYDYAYRGVNPAAPLPGQPPTDEKDLPYIDKNFSISGYGVGVSLLVKQNFSLRCDYGVALTELRDDTRLQGEEVILAKGNEQVYLVASFSW